MAIILLPACLEVVPPDCLQFSVCFPKVKEQRTDGSCYFYLITTNYQVFLWWPPLVVRTAAITISILLTTLSVVDSHDGRQKHKLKEEREEKKKKNEEGNPIEKKIEMKEG